MAVSAAAGSIRKLFCPSLRQGGFFSIKRPENGHSIPERGFPRKKLPPDCAFCTENIPGDETEQIKKENLRSKKHFSQMQRRCDRISLGCKGLVRYKSCRPAICVDAGGCHPAIAEMGYFRGVCPILEPGERITDSDGIRSSAGRPAKRAEPMFGFDLLIDFRENCRAVHRFF